MKNLKYIFCLLVMLSISIASYAAGQVNSFTVVSVTPASGGAPYNCGTLITVLYDLEYRMEQSKQTQVAITFDNSQVELVSCTPDIYNLFNNPVLTGTSGGIQTYTYATNPFGPGDEGYITFTEFTVTYRVKNCECTNTAVNSGITAVASMPTIAGSLSNVVPVNVMNSSPAPLVSMELIDGSACDGSALYKITSVGYDVDNSGGNSSLALTVPTGVSVNNVYNTSGSDAYPTTAGGVTTWYRYGDPVEKIQIHYVMMSFDPASYCASQVDGYPYAYPLNITFTTHDICEPHAANTVSAVLTNTCTCTSGDGGGDGHEVADVYGGKVIIHKWLKKTPFRYLSQDKNCKTHHYYVRISNISPQTLSSFALTDYISNIISGVPNAIMVNSITARLDPVFTAPGTFDFTMVPATTSLGPVTSPWGPQSLYAPGAYPATGLYPAPNMIWDNTMPQNLTLTGNIVFPANTRLLLDIEHRLDINEPQSQPYFNKAELTFNALDPNNVMSPFDIWSQVTSYQDNYEPVLTVSKTVSLYNTSTNLPYGGFSHGTTASPNETVQFEIKIRNYGMKDAENVTLADVLTHLTANNFNGITNVRATGSMYTATELTAIENLITAGFTGSTGFNCIIPIVKAAPCPDYSELIITFLMPLKSCTEVVCNSKLTNIATIGWSFVDNAGVTQTRSSSDAATVDVDLFKYIQFSLEASCNTKKPVWKSVAFDALPQQHVIYRARVRNMGTCPVANLKMYVQTPCGIPPATNSSDQGIAPTDLFQSTKPLLGGGVEVVGVISKTVLNGTGVNTGNQNKATDLWLSSNISPVQFTGDQSIYYLVTNINPSGVATIQYTAKAPVYTLGSVYNTVLGVSMSSMATGANCPVIRKTDLKLTLAAVNECDSFDNCELIKFDRSIKKTGPNRYTIKISNILHTGGGYINMMNIVVGQPYKDCLVPGDFDKPMLPLELGAFTSSFSPASGTPMVGERHMEFAIGGTGNLGNVEFDINTNVVSSPNCVLIFPVNIMFTKKDGCDPCETTIYLSIKMSK